MYKFMYKYVNIYTQFNSLHIQLNTHIYFILVNFSYICYVTTLNNCYWLSLYVTFLFLPCTGLSFFFHLISQDSGQSFFFFILFAEELFPVYSQMAASSRLPKALQESMRRDCKAHRAKLKQFYRIMINATSVVFIN